ncbi:hypothetical protein Q0Z83_067840 [Actinoplanes sichuanensis]|uniref:DUF2231 domain-containing protein n=1 Tax=Actinoplanes sichuanensis TaxID=512349 RepID=A0ABW4AC84_9ACTN|nr:DUF2231 domain-containing protein [Actinoplanes sichuanensis]BEL08593.1 hypothetical protein Q0Z83_067840 [Actinoplanes sichuanensis]
MESRLRLAGHGMQPLLLMFPLGLFWMAFVLDLAVLMGAPSLLGTVAFWNLVAGLGGGLLATAAAITDAVVATGPAGVRIFVLALLLDVGVLIIYAVLTLTRVRDPHRTASAPLLTLELLGLVAAAFTAWFSGRFAAPGAPVSDRRTTGGRRHTPPPATATLNQLLTHPPDRHPRRQAPHAAPPPSRPGPAQHPAAAPPTAAAPAPSLYRAPTTASPPPPRRSPAASPSPAPRRSPEIPPKRQRPAAPSRRPTETPPRPRTASFPRDAEKPRAPGSGRTAVEDAQPTARTVPGPPRQR